jgi:uncharacterized protein YceH (UPF0502 family)
MHHFDSGSVCCPVEEKMRLPRELDVTEIRVLGALLEKEQTTPEYFPLTVKALVSACNQKSNRHPVMDLSETDVVQTLDRLHEEVLVWPVEGARVQRWRHNLDRRWELDSAKKAVMTLLLVRGAQTPGELRGRSDRMHHFVSTIEVDRALADLASGDEPLVVQLARQPGQKEARWCHLVGGTPDQEAVTQAPLHSSSGTGLTQRVSDLEARVAELEQKLDDLIG